MFVKQLLILTGFIVGILAFEVPDATVEVLKPRGFKISIPALEGIKLFAVHVNFNEEFNGREAGEINWDVNAPENGRWTYTDLGKELKPGDVIYFWTYADYFDGVNRLGYGRDDQEYVVPKEEPIKTVAPVEPVKVETFNLNLPNSACSTPSVTTASGTYKPQQICSGELIFSDEFDNFDLAKWKHENTLGGGGNWEFQWYLNNRTNSFVENGKLHIHPTLLAEQFGEKFLSSGTLDINGGSPADSCTNPAYYGCKRTGNPINILNPIKSARIQTSNSFSFKYGRVEISAKTPRGDWMWPAVWLMPRYNAYGTWPASGEIDLLESRGNKQLTFRGKNVGTNLVTSTLHFGPDASHNGYEKAHFEKDSPNGFDEAFHNYTLVWTPESIAIYYDGERVGEVKPDDGGFWALGGFEGLSNPWKNGSKMAPFDQEMYLIMNVAVGGVNGYFSDESNGKPWRNSSPKAATDFWKGRQSWLPSWQTGSVSDHSLQVDYVRIYAL